MPVLQEVGEHFIDFIAPLLQGPKTRQTFIAKLGSAQWKPYNMFREKIHPGLLDLLSGEGLVRTVSDHEVEFDASIGGLYMVSLAKQMAVHQPIVSDDPMYELLTHVPLQGTGGAAPVDHGLRLASAVFTSAVPIDIESADIRDVIKFRRDFEGDRRAFYDWIAAFRSDLAKISDPKQLVQAVDHHKAAIEARMVALKQRFQLLNLKCGNGIFTFSLPGWVTAAWGLGTDNPAVLIGGGVLVLAGVAANAVLEHRMAKTDAPVSYIHTMRKQLKPKEYAGELIQMSISGI
jgi:hypothetical protein